MYSCSSCVNMDLTQKTGTITTHSTFLMCLLQGILTSVSAICNTTASPFNCNNYTTTAVRPFPSNYTTTAVRPFPSNYTTTSFRHFPSIPEDEDNHHYAAFYTVAIFFGVVGLPLAIMFRVCWVRRLNARYQRQMAEAGRARHRDDPDRPEVFSVDIDPGSFLPSYEQCIADSPPPYDQIPPQYNLKKNKSSASLPSYTAEVSTSQTAEVGTCTSYPEENTTPHPPETHDRSTQSENGNT